MIRYYLLIFVRNLQRQKMFSLINLLGLTAGIVSSLLIYLYVQHERSYDRFHANADNIYRVNQTFIWGEDNNQLFSSTGPGVAHAISAEIPEVKEVVRIHPPGNALVTYATWDKQVLSFDEDEILAVDSGFFKVFSFELLKGNPETALKEVNTMVITESTATKYFGDSDPMGKLLQVGSFGTDETVTAFEVTGVVKDPPSNSYIDFDFLLSMSSFPRVKKQSWSWIWTMFETYVLVEPNATASVLGEKLSKLPPRYAEATLQNAMGTSYDAYVANGKQWNLYAQPLTEIHLYSGAIYNRLNDVGNYKIMYILIGIVVFIILLSCINFMNLSTAQYTRRAKETSLRKMLGSSRLQLGLIFFVEAFLFCSISLLIAVGITQIILPAFNQITGNNYSLNIFGDSTILSTMVSLLFVMSILCGSYPALFLTAFKPVEALKGKVRSGREGKLLRNGLVVFQFAVSIILLVCTMVVFNQLKFLSEKDTGFDRENLLVVDRLEWVKDKQTFINALKTIKGIENVSWCTSAPPKLYDGDSFKAEDTQDKTISLNYVNVDANYAPTLKLQFKVGRNFVDENPSDYSMVILNESAVHQLGWNVDETVIGKKIYYPGIDEKFEVVGVVKDFNYWSLQAPINPMAMFNIRGKMYSMNSEFVTIRLSAADTESWNGLIGSIEKQWKKFAGDAPFQYEFVDDGFAEAFAGEKKFSEALSVFAALAVLIACLGLLGMVMFTLELRLKEIGIRKVIGASAGSILRLVSTQYVKLIIIAVLLSAPVSLWMMNKWLEGFEYKIEPGVSTFIIAGLITFSIAFVITAYQTLKAAFMNPVDVLKDE
jgi:putative ABC transport system permease protein